MTDGEILATMTLPRLVRLEANWRRAADGADTEQGRRIAAGHVEECRNERHRRTAATRTEGAANG